MGQVRDGLSEGRVSEAQATVIVRALGELPTDLDPELRVKAEAHLVAEAAHFEPRRLRVLGRKVLEVIAPDIADDHERKLLEREEALARRQTSLTFRRRGDGTTDIHDRLSDAVAARLRTYLEAYTAPRRSHLDDTVARTDPDTGQVLPQSVLFGHAFASMLESIATDGLPQHGGTSTQVVVTIDHETLKKQLGVAGLDTGDLVTVSETMRLACNAQILPLVLNGDGQPLHLGRARRLFSAGQRVAMGVRDKECRTHGCSIPAAWCEAHHLSAWASDGKTDIDDGLLLCPWHHHRAHDPAYQTDRMPNGDLRFNRRR